MLEDAALVERRRRWLVDALREHQRIVTNDAADALGVSVDTVRRDLRALDADGLVRRVHGGAVPRSSLPSSYAGRRSIADGARTRLASAVVQRIRPHSVVGLDAGTTNVEVARLLPRDLAVTIVTSNPPAAAELAGHPSARVVLIGGVVDLDWMATTGPEAVAAWAGYRLDLGVVGMCAVDPQLGGSTNSLAEVSTKRAIMAASAEVIVPVQLDKLATTASFVVCATSEIDAIITDADADAETVRSFRGLGVEITLV